MIRQAFDAIETRRYLAGEVTTGTHNGATFTAHHRYGDAFVAWSVERPGSRVSGHEATVAEALDVIRDYAERRDETGALSFAGSRRNAVA